MRARSLEASGRFPWSAAFRALASARSAKFSLRSLAAHQYAPTSTTTATTETTAIAVLRFFRNHSAVLLSRRSIRCAVATLLPIVVRCRIPALHRSQGILANAPGVTRTRGQRFRKPLLYPPELQGLATEDLKAK